MLAKMRVVFVKDHLANNIVTVRIVLGSPQHVIQQIKKTLLKFTALYKGYRLCCTTHTLQKLHGFYISMKHKLNPVSKCHRDQSITMIQHSVRVMTMAI